MDYQVEHPEFGTIRYVTNNRAKRIIITVKPDYIRVTRPSGQLLKNAQHFLEEKIGWIRGQKRKMNLNVQKSRELPKIQKKNARRILNQRLNELAKFHDFHYNRVSIRNQKTRWGSCSSKNNISLNKKILYLPPELIDYVLLHELVHTKIKNHGKEFWRELDKMVPKSKKVDKRLQNYQHCLI